MIGVLLAILYTGIFIFLIKKHSFFKIENSPNKWLVYVFLLKIFSGTALWFVYTRLYTDHSTADIFKYFDDGKAIYGALFSRPLEYFKMLLGFSDSSNLQYYQNEMNHWSREFNQKMANENRTLIRFNALVDIFSFGNYHVHTVFMCFLSFTGLVGIYKTFLPFVQNKQIELFVAVFFLPSVLFWGSGVLKEGLILFATGMLIYHWFKLLKKGISFTRLIIILLFIGLLSITKIYILFIMLPALFAHTWVAKTNSQFPLLKYTIVIIVFISAGLMLPNFDFPFMLMEKQRQSIYLSKGGAYLMNEKAKRYIYIKPEIRDRIIYIKNKPGYCKVKPGIPYIDWTKDNFLDTGHVENSLDTNTYWIYYNQDPAGSKIDIPILYPTFLSMVKIAPAAFFNSLFRPHLLEAKNPLMLLSAFENLLIIFCLISSLAFHSKKNKNWHLLYFCMTIVVLLFILVGITTPILGAAVRYKMPALPFLLIAFLLIVDKDKIVQKFPFLKKTLHRK